MQSRTTSQTGSYNLLLNPGYIFLEGKPAKGTTGTVLRVLPFFDEQGNEVPALDEAQHKYPTDALGPMFMRMEVCHFWRGTQHYLPTLVRPDSALADETGELVPSFLPTLCRRIKAKVRDAQKLVQARLTPDIGQDWEQFSNNCYVYHRVMVQAIVTQVDGKSPAAGMDGVARPLYPVVLMFTSKAIKDFAAQAMMVRNAEHPRSVTNNYFGDFCTCAGGHTLWITRVDEGQVSYYVRLGEPYPLDPQEAPKYVRPWDSVLAEPTNDDLMEIMIKLTDPIYLDYGLRDSEWYDMLPDRIKGKAGSVADPTAFPQQGAPQSAQQGASQGAYASYSPQQAPQGYPSNAAQPSWPTPPAGPAYPQQGGQQAPSNPQQPQQPQQQVPPPWQPPAQQAPATPQQPQQQVPPPWQPPAQADPSSPGLPPNAVPQEMDPATYAQNLQKFSPQGAPPAAAAPQSTGAPGVSPPGVMPGPPVIPPKQPQGTATVPPNQGASPHPPFLPPPPQGAGQ